MGAHKSPHCPVCGYSLDINMGTDGSREAPRNGDISLCFSCCSTLVFDISEVSSGVRIPTEEEQKVFDQDEEILKIKKLMKEVKYGKNGLN